jgi:hypothetical protein
MKNQISNIVLEGTCNGDVVGGLLLWTGESLQALLFLIATVRGIRCKRNLLTSKKKAI